LEALRARGADWAELTLHVGVGTFRPVKTSDIREHVMHEERFFVPETTASAMSSAERICAVGTTTVRTLESAVQDGLVRAGAGRTQIFFYPGCGREFQVVDRMLTNFHLPESTLLMMISAFAGRDLVMQAYKEAVRQRYRFFSYGDAMLIL
jgi:S-adenosylmethionine:tRNA ribosyltransferase-isomerase